MAAVANSGGALISLKNKMQGLRDEMEKTKQQLDSKTLELEQERALRSKVCDLKHYKETNYEGQTF